MTTKPLTYIVCDHCGAMQAITGEQIQGVDADGRSHRAIDLPCGTCGRPGAIASAPDGGTETMRRIVERENDIAG